MTTWPYMHIIIQPLTWLVQLWHIIIWPLTWLVQLWHIIILPLTWLVQLWEVPRRTPWLIYINQEFVAIKRNCSDGTPVVSDCLSLAKGLAWRTAGSPLLGTPRLCWGKFHCLSLSAERPPQFATRIHRFCIQLSYPLVSVERILFTMCQVLLWESLLKLGHSSYPQGSPAEEEDIKIIINIYWGKYNNRTCILFGYRNV